MIVATVPIANWALAAFGPPEVFALIVFGLTVASSVGAESIWKGWISVIIGLLISTVGTEPAGGMPRFDFGTNFLMRDRKSVVEGKSVSVRVDHGGRRIIKKKTQKKKTK